MLTDASWEWTKRFATVTGLISVAIGVGFFFFNQNQRISTLEAQLQAATITTSIMNVPAPLVERTDNPSTSATSAQSINPQSLVSVNPIVLACADMARKISEKGAPLGALDPIYSAMNAIGCARVGNQK